MSDLDGGAPAPADVTPASAPVEPGVQPPKPVSAEPIAPEPEKKPEPTPRDALKRAAEKVEKLPGAEPKKDAPKADKPEKPEPVKADGPSRAPDGKFAGKEAQERPQDSRQPVKAVEAAPRPATPASDAPQRFSDSAKSEWANAPESVRAEAKRAIDELTKGHEKYKADAEAYGSLAPFEQKARERGSSLHNIMTAIDRIDQIAQRDRVAGANEFFAQMGWPSLEQFAQHITGRAPDAAAAHFTQQVQEQRQRADHFERLAQQQAAELNQFRQEREQNHQRTLVQEVASFSADKPRFGELSPVISRLLLNGTAETLQEAYTYAERLHPSAAPPAPNTGPSSAPAADLKAQTLKGLKSIAGAPTPGSDPGNRTSSTTTRDALKRAFAAVG